MTSSIDCYIYMSTQPLKLGSNFREICLILRASTAWSHPLCLYTLDTSDLRKYTIQSYKIPSVCFFCYRRWFVDTRSVNLLVHKPLFENLCVSFFYRRWFVSMKSVTFSVRVRMETTSTTSPTSLKTCPPVNSTATSSVSKTL